MKELKKLLVLPFVASMLLVGCKHNNVEPTPEPEPEPFVEKTTAEEVIRAVASIFWADDVNEDGYINPEEFIDPVIDEDYWESENTPGLFETSAIYDTSVTQAQLVNYGVSLSTSILEYNEYAVTFGEVYATEQYTECDASVDDTITLEVYSLDYNHPTYGEVRLLVFDAYETPAE